MSSSEHPRKSVAFDGESTVRYIESTSRKPRKSPNMAKQLFERFNGTELTDHMLEEAAQLFNENYGIWAVDPTNPGPAPKPVWKFAYNRPNFTTLGSCRASPHIQTLLHLASDRSIPLASLLSSFLCNPPQRLHLAGHQCCRPAHHRALDNFSGSEDIRREFLEKLDHYDVNVSQLAQLDEDDRTALLSYSTPHLRELEVMWQQIRKDKGLYEDEVVPHILKCQRFNLLHGMTHIDHERDTDVTLSTSDDGECTINPATPWVIYVVDDNNKTAEHPLFLMGHEPTGSGPRRNQQFPRSPYNARATEKAGLRAKELLRVVYGRLEADNRQANSASFAKSLAPSP